jgi:hypothetical protein
MKLAERAKKPIFSQEAVHTLHVRVNSGCVFLVGTLQVQKVLAGFGLNPFTKLKVPIGDILFYLISYCFGKIFHAGTTC